RGDVGGDHDGRGYGVFGDPGLGPREVVVDRAADEVVVAGRGVEPIELHEVRHDVLVVLRHDATVSEKERANAHVLDRGDGRQLDGHAGVRACVANDEGM